MSGVVGRLLVSIVMDIVLGCRGGRWIGRVRAGCGNLYSSGWVGGVVRGFARRLGSPISTLFSLFFGRLRIGPLRSVIVLGRVGRGEYYRVDSVLFLCSVWYG